MKDDRSLMSVATKYIFAQSNEHAQMSEKVGIKIRDLVMVTMVSEHK